MKTDSSIAKPIRRLREQLRLVAADAILAAAEDAFAEHGIHATRMEEIAARAGVAVGTLYNHFADRQALLDALRSTRVEALLAQLDRELEATKGRPFREQLDGFLRTLLEHLAAHAGFFSALTQAEHRPRSDEVDARARKLMHRGVLQKVLRPKQAELHAAAFLGMVRGVIALELREGRGDRVAALADPIADLFLDGAKA